tara:strand:+ start:70 stop:444 length:375 start_codon:yes stop_codon:yes gene_type:complete
MRRKSNKLFRDTIKEHLKKAQKENPKVDLILADGNPRSDRDKHENMYKIGIVDDDYFPDKTVLKIFEGGIVYLAEDGEKFYLIIDESTMASILDEEDLPDELVKTIEFDTVKERDEYIKSRGWD